MRAEPFRILLVEDNDADVYLFGKALEDAGVNYELIEIDDGAEALAFVRGEGDFREAQRPDIAVLDMNLPKNEGMEVLEALRMSKDLSKLPVVVMTSSASPAERARMERLGVDRFVTKPPDLAEFLQIGSVVKELLFKVNAREAS
jgi:CheY-like chemotaxis protein